MEKAGFFEIFLMFIRLQCALLPLGRQISQRKKNETSTHLMELEFLLPVSCRYLEPKNISCHPSTLLQSLVLILSCCILPFARQIIMHLACHTHLI